MTPFKGPWLTLCIPSGTTERTQSGVVHSAGAGLPGHHQDQLVQPLVFVETIFFHGSKIEGGLGPPWPPPDSDDGGGVA